MIWAVVLGVFPSVALESVGCAVLIREMKYLLLRGTSASTNQGIYL